MEVSVHCRLDVPDVDAIRGDGLRVDEVEGVVGLLKKVIDHMGIIIGHV